MSEAPLYLDWNKDLKMIFVRGEHNKIVTRIPMAEAVRVLRGFAAMVPESDMCLRSVQAMKNVGVIRKMVKDAMNGMQERKGALMTLARMTGHSVEACSLTLDWLLGEES